MAEKKPYLVGSARLSDLNGFEDCMKNNVRGCFIPYDQNPSLFLGASKQTGALTVDMDILIRETQNSKSGSTHFIKLYVGKANRERFNLSQEAVESLKIVGNLFTRIPGQQGQQQQSYGNAPAGGYQQPQGGQYPPRPQMRQAAPQQNAYRPQSQNGGFQNPNDALPAGW